ncbi:hypothetical protein AOA80_02315 [Methanomassiliicoccales archaeon RumEn M1]|nr:hypothetical protein AOA80_02315 [Methanomassiliicoccales archaeon RumEn M1]
MRTMEHFRNRRSVRNFTEEDVPEEVVVEALEAGNLAPSAGNLQARDFVVVRDDEKKHALAEAAFSQRFVAQAPVVIVCCANQERIAEYGPRGRELYCVQDVAAAVQNMLLYLADAGYGSCWVGAFNEKKVTDLLRLPSHVRPVAMLPVGRPAGQGRSPPRMGLDVLVHREEW